MKLLLERLLSENNYRLDEHDVSLQLLSHPDYPSIKSITDTLDYFKVENAALQIDSSLLGHLPEVFIAETKENDFTEMVLVKVKKESIRVVNDRGEFTRTSKQHFKDIWNGKAVAVEPLPHRLFKTRFPGLVPLLLVTFVLCFQLLDYNFFALTGNVTLLLGFAITFLILLDEYREMPPMLNKLCKAINENSNCLEVAKDARGKIFKKFSLGDLSGVLLSSLLLTQTIVGWNPSLGLVMIFFILPVLLYSLYLQFFLIKKWCVLCLAISCLFLLYSAICFIALIGQPKIFQLSYFLKFGVILVGISYLWFVASNLFRRNNELSKTESAFFQFKRNARTFSILLSHEQKITALGQDAPHITFGNAKAEIAFMAITNPLCGYCKDAFYEYKKLLDHTGELIKLDFIFNVANREDSNAWIISNQMIALYRQEGSEKCWVAMEEWFHSRNIDAWLTKYQRVAVTNQTSLHIQWCAENKIYHTPATVLDGHLYPTTYAVGDFALLAEDYLANKRSKLQDDILKD